LIGEIEMKILYITTISNTVNAFLIPHIKMLIDEGHQVDVAFNVEKEVEFEIKKMGCKIYEVPFERNPFNKNNIIAYKLLKQIIEDERYDLVHTHTPVASTITRLVCRNFENIAVYYTAHGFHFFKGAPLKNWLIYYPIEKILSRYTDFLITMNNEDHDISIKKKFKAKKIAKVNGVGVSFTKFSAQTDSIKYKLRKEYSYRDEDFILIYVGELSYRKHQDLLINSVAVARKYIPELKLILVGEGSLRSSYESLIKKLGVENHVELLGFRKDVPELMLLSDVAVSASRHEGLPVNVMEAMSTGLPLVVSDCRGNTDLVKDGFNGYVVGTDDVKMMSDRIIDLYQNDEKKQEFKKNNIELVNKYSLDSVLEEMRQIYSEIR
jgi:glycosyltransferase EpsD